MEPSTGSLAAHFPTRRRIFGTPGADSDALVKQAQAELKRAEEAKKTVFRFNFDLSGDLDDAPKKKKKNKKKKKKSKAKAAAVAEDDTKVDATGDAAESEPVAVAPVAVTPDQVAKLKSPATKPAKAKPAPKTATATAAPTVKKGDKSKVTKETETPVPSVEPAGFLKLKKPTSSDSEVMKMHLRYGRGKRNLAAIAQREKKKKEQQQQEHDDAVSGKEAPSNASGSGFQFNFFS